MNKQSDPSRRYMDVIAALVFQVMVLHILILLMASGKAGFSIFIGVLFACYFVVESILLICLATTLYSNNVSNSFRFGIAAIFLGTTMLALTLGCASALAAHSQFDPSAKTFVTCVITFVLAFSHFPMLYLLEASLHWILLFRKWRRKHRAETER